ncbi:MAG: hypothetical protein R3247_06675 [Rhodothermales bacterium]|nr:hypothetical protein [Rhodothermales bacterium]
MAAKKKTLKISGARSVEIVKREKQDDGTEVVAGRFRIGAGEEEAKELEKHLTADQKKRLLARGVLVEE